MDVVKYPLVHRGNGIWRFILMGNASINMENYDCYVWRHREGKRFMLFLPILTHAHFASKGSNPEAIIKIRPNRTNHNKTWTQRVLKNTWTMSYVEFNLSEEIKHTLVGTPCLWFIQLDISMQLPSYIWIDSTNYRNEFTRNKDIVRMIPPSNSHHSSTALIAYISLIPIK